MARRLTDFKLLGKNEAQPCVVPDCGKVAQRQYRNTLYFVCMEHIRDGQFDAWLSDMMSVTETEEESQTERPLLSVGSRRVTTLEKEALFSLSRIYRGERGREGRLIRKALDYLMDKIRKGEVPL